MVCVGRFEARLGHVPISRLNTTCLRPPSLPNLCLVLHRSLTSIFLSCISQNVHSRVNYCLLRSIYQPLNWSRQSYPSQSHIFRQTEGIPLPVLYVSQNTNLLQRKRASTAANGYYHSRCYRATCSPPLVPSDDSESEPELQQTPKSSSSKPISQMKPPSFIVSLSLVSQSLKSKVQLQPSPSPAKTKGPKKVDVQ